MEVSASLLNVKEEEAITTFYRLEMAHTDYFHIDVMDGKFVANNTIEKMKEYADNLKNITNIPLDIHIMCKNVREYVDMFASCEPRIINFHLEAFEKENDINAEDKKAENVEEVNKASTLENKAKVNEKKVNDTEIFEMIKYIKSSNCKVGIAINPETNIESVYKFLPVIHNVLIMSVHPGKGGQKFIDGTVNKIKKLKDYIENNHLENEIEVDGGINFETAKKVSEAGANIVSVGSYLINSKDYKYTISEMQKM